jgi:hypothetical protein
MRSSIPSKQPRPHLELSRNTSLKQAWKRLAGISTIGFAAFLPVLPRRLEFCEIPPIVRFTCNALQWVMQTALQLPLKWTKPQIVFVNSMSDLFHPEVPEDFIRRGLRMGTSFDRF